MSSPLASKTIGFIGAGNMAEAMILALRHGLGLAPEKILAADPNPVRREYLTAKCGIRTTADNMAVFMAADMVVLAVKPQQIPNLLKELTENPQYGDISKRKQILSIAAGIPLAFLEEQLTAPLTVEKKELLVVMRVMPNTPALIGCGMSGISRSSGARDEDMHLTLTLVAAMGKTCILPESLMDALTALSGSGPAYLFLLAESMIRAGEALGLSAEDALTLTLQTLKGAVALLEKGETDAATLRQRVTSPGGTTAAAIRVFQEGGFEDLVLKAIMAARDRSRELSRSLV